MIAKELGRSSQEIMRALNELGAFVRSPSSVIDHEKVAKLQERFGAAARPSAKDHGPATAPCSKRPQPTATVPLGQDSWAQAILAEAAASRHAREAETDASVRSLLDGKAPRYRNDRGASGRREERQSTTPPPPPRTREPQEGTSDPFVQALLPSNRFPTATDIHRANMLAMRWRMTGISVERIGEWLRAGADIEEAFVVRDLINEGVSPDRAPAQFQHPLTGEMTTIFELARYVPYYTTLGKILDEAEIERNLIRRRA